MYKFCPHCKTYRLSIWRNIFLHPTLPSECPNCKQQYVLSKLGFLYRSLFFILFVGLTSYLLADIYNHRHVIFWSTPIGLLLGSFISNPVPHRGDKPAAR